MHEKKGSSLCRSSVPSAKTKKGGSETAEVNEQGDWNFCVRGSCKAAPALVSPSKEA